VGGLCPAAVDLVGAFVERRDNRYQTGPAIDREIPHRLL
jgi:hypothetical protein